MTRYSCLTVTLNPAIDQFVQIPDFRPGQDCRAREFFSSAGGKGINVSRALRRLEITALATGLVGGCPGEFIERELEREGIPHDFMTVREETRVSLTIRDPGTKRQTRILHEGQEISRGERLAFWKKYTRLLQRCDFVVLSGRNIPGAGEDFYARLVNQGRRLGKKVVLDTSGRPFALAVKARPFAVKPNRKEAEEWLGWKLDSRKRLRQAVQSLLDCGISKVMISLNKDGLILADRQDCVWARAPKINPVNTVGCGDAAVAGFIDAESRGWDLARTARWTVAAGTVSATALTPGEITRRSCKGLLRRVTVTQL